MEDLVRTLRRKDLSQITRFLRRVESFRHADVECALDDIRDWLASRDGMATHFLCCVRGGEVAGFACWDEVPIARGTYELNWICTDPRFERTGVGRALIRHAERELKRRGARLLVVETSSRPEYSKVHRFLWRNGFRRAARFRDFWADGEDKIVFQKRLNAKGGGM